MSGYTFVGRLDHRAKERGWGGWETIAAEADAIERTFQNKMPQDGWKGRGRDMRLHISGDTYNESSTWILGTAASNYMLRGGGRVWTYTHRWREVARDRWKLVSALASVESVDEFKEAERQGYAMAITLPYFPTEKAFQVPGRPDLRVVPCLAETRGLTCIECRLCFDDKKLREKGIVIGFSLHGTNSTVASQRLGERQGDLIGKVPLVLRGQRVRLKVVG